jgi:lambda family phage portal protein
MPATRTPKTLEERAKDAELRLRLDKAKLERNKVQLHAKAIRAQKTALSAYQAADRNRTNRDWQTKNRSADSAILPDRPTMDARSRQMIRDDPHIKSIQRAFKRNVVGTGITATSIARDRAGNLLADFNKRADTLFYDWARNKRLVDKERRRNFWQFQRWAMDEIVAVGEAIMLIGYEHRPAHQCGLVLQAIEAEQLDLYKYEHEGREVRGGVEVDEFGAAVAYWIWPRHPFDVRGLARPAPLSLQSVRFEARRIVHVYDAERVRQTRGVTRLTPVLQKARDLNTYDYAQLLAAKAEACIGMVIKTDPANSDRIGMNQGADGGQRQDMDGNDELAMQPIMVARLNEGEEMSSFTPTRPGGQYKPFVDEQKRMIAAGAGTSYEQVARDFHNGNFSSQRQNALEDRREFEAEQQMLISDMCEPIRNEALRCMVMEGKLLTPFGQPRFDENPDMYTYADWKGQGWPWVDPAKQSVGYERAIANGFTSKRRVLNELGYDHAEIAKEQAEDEKIEIEARQKQGLAPKTTEDQPPKSNGIGAPRLNGVNRMTPHLNGTGGLH